MNQDETIPVSIVALRADAYSPDGKNVIIPLKTKFSTAERNYASTDARSSELSIQAAVAPNPAEHMDVTMADEDSWK